MKKFKTIIKISVFISTVMFLFNKLLSKINNMNNSLNKNNIQYYNSKFGKISYQKFGTGSPVLLIHNVSHGDNFNEWKYIAKKINNRTVYLINLPGCGNSDKSLTKYTNYIFAKCVIDFINEIICEKTDIITSGNSAKFALMISALDTNCINKNIFINPPALSERSSKKIKKYNNIITTPLLGTFIYNLTFSKHRTFNNCIQKFYSGNFRTNSYINNYYDSIHYKNSNSKFLYLSIVNNYLNDDIKHFIKNSKKLYLIIGKNRNNNISIFNSYKKLNDNIEYNYIDNSIEYPHIDNPIDTVNIINNIL